jgi:putative membrane protein
MFHHYGPGWGPGWWVLGGFLWLAFWVVVVVLIVSLVRGRHHHPHGEDGLGQSDALRVLEDRYARGEIDRDEFLERRAVLRGGAPPPPPKPPPANLPPDTPTDPTPTEQL